MRIILVRHGDAVNSNGKFHGRVDNPMTDKGKAEIARIAPKLKQYNATMIYCSPMSRTRDSADIIAKELKIPVKSQSALLPLDLGFFVGKPISSFLERVKHFIDNPDKQIPHGQTVNEWASKYLPFFQQMFHHKSSDDNESVIFVTHGRNILLSKAYIKAGEKSPKWDKQTLLDSDKSTEHGGYAVADPKGNPKFTIVTPKSVQKGQS